MTDVLPHAGPTAVRIDSVHFQAGHSTMQPNLTLVFRPRCLHAVHRYGLLHVPWSVCGCVGHTGELYKKMVEPSEMPFGG